jgi:hypothetical protein
LDDVLKQLAIRLLLQEYLRLSDERSLGSGGHRPAGAAGAQLLQAPRRSHMLTPQTTVTRRASTTTIPSE